MKSLSIKTKMLLAILTISFLSFATAIGIVTIKARDNSNKAAIDISDGLASRYAAETSDYLGRALLQAKDIASMAGTFSLRKIDRESAIEVIRNILKNSPEILGGWMIFEPNSYDGDDAQHIGKSGSGVKDGRFFPYVVRSGSEIIVEPLSDSDEEPFYKIPKETGKVYIVDPFEWEIDGKTETLTSFCVPIKKDGKIIGVAGVDIILSKIQEFFAGINPMDTGYAGLFSDKGNYVASPVEENIGKKIEDTKVLNAITEGKVFIVDHFSDISKEEMLNIFKPLNISGYHTPWSVQIALPKEKIEAGAKSILRTGLVVGLIALVTLTIVVLFMVNRTTKAISAIAELLDKISRLDLTFDKSKLWLLNYKDEIGHMSEALKKMNISLSEIIKKIAEETERNTEKSESLMAASEESHASMKEIEEAVRIVTALTEDNAAALEESNASSEEVATGAKQTAEAATEAAEASLKGSEENKTAIESVNKAIEGIKEAEKVSRGSIVQIRELAGSIEDIVGFVGDITRIADQTNLLALNAAIEAARAGEAGRGFAVVAEEVRKLAEESATSAEKIEKIIDILQKNSEKSIRETEQTGNILSESIEISKEAQEKLQKAMDFSKKVNESIQSIAAISEEQASSSGEMTASLSQITKANMDTVGRVESIKNASEETGKATENVAKESEKVAESAATIKSLIDKFQFDEDIKKID